MVARMRAVEPAPVVAHEVPQTVLVVRGVLEERYRPVENRRPYLLVLAARKLERDDREAGDVVDAIPALSVRDDTVRVLDDAHVVHEREEVIRPHADALPVDHHDRRPLARRELHRLGEDCRGRRRDGRPGELVADPARLGARSRQRIGLLDVAADGLRERVRVAERHQRPGAGGEHVLRIPVRGGDDAAAGREAEGQRPRRDLLAVAVGGHEDVRRCEQVGDLVDAEEAVVELDVILQAEIEHGLLQQQPIALALAAGDVGMRPARDEVAHLRVALDDGRERSDHGLEALPCGDQAEGGERERALPRCRPRSSGLSPSARSTASSLARRAITRGAPCGTTRTFAAGHAPPVTSRSRAVSVITITSCACMHTAARTLAWCGVGADSTVCRVTTSGCESSSVRDATYSPSRPPKIPYSCCSRTTSTSSRPRIRAART